jgi:hypothetical protein
MYHSIRNSNLFFPDFLILKFLHAEEKTLKEKLQKNINLHIIDIKTYSILFWRDIELTFF